MIYPPRYVKDILFKLQSRGFSAYLVGGCVRDILLEKHPQDWDICTDALPDQILSLFSNSKLTGSKHGTVTVSHKGRSVEITTFRIDGDYYDHRRPEYVKFVTDLQTDLSRRDFTVNAMALSPNGDLIDPFHGLKDLNDKVIRCVGDPKIRFEEDALRMFRAIRFSARYGFTIDALTYQAIGDNSSLTSFLAYERIRDEIEKILLSKHANYIREVLDLGLVDHITNCEAGPSPYFSFLTVLPKKSYIRWAGFCHVMVDRGLIESVHDFLQLLRLDNRTIKICVDCESVLHSFESADTSESKTFKKFLSRYSHEAVVSAVSIYDSLHQKHFKRVLKEVLSSGECYSLDTLAVSGNDLLEVGLSGPVLGDMLYFLLDYVIEHPDRNQRSILLSIAKGSEE